MASYKELKDGFLEEVSKIDVGSLGLCCIGGLKDYAELLKTIASLPEDTFFNQLSDTSFGISTANLQTPKKETKKAR